MMLLKQMIWLCVGALLVLAGVFGYSLVARMWSPAHGAAPSRHESELATVKTITPKLDEHFVRSTTAPAYVEAYSKADLFAHVAGPIKYIQKDIGDPVSEGELLVVIDIPDLLQEVAQKDAFIRQAEADRDAAEAHLQTLTEALETAKFFVPEKEAFVEQMVATRDLRRAEWQRFKTLLLKDAVNRDLVEERERDFKVSIAALKTAELSVATARSELHGAEAKLAEARADLRIKEARIQVAQKDKERVQAQASFAQIRAPISGYITKRNYDVGDFVQNATTAKTEPMLTIMRIDIVTVVTLVPERQARFVADGQEAILNIEIQDRKIKNLAGKVMRHSPTLDKDKGRTMRLEVNLYNPPLYGYKRSVREGIASFLSPLGASQPAEGLALWQAGRQLWSRPGLLQHGMYGTMKIVLERFDNPRVIPSAAIFNREGKTCIFLVKDNVATLARVHIQLEDGVRAKVAIVDREASPDSGDDDTTHELRGDEEIVVSGQGDIADGQEVHPQPSPW